MSNAPVVITFDTSALNLQNITSIQVRLTDCFLLKFLVFIYNKILNVLRTVMDAVMNSKGGVFLDLFSDIQLLERDYAPWS
jgi:hypothetical protein